MRLPWSLLSANTLGLTAVVIPLRARPPLGLRCHIGHLAEAPLDPPRSTRCTWVGGLVEGDVLMKGLVLLG